MSTQAQIQTYIDFEPEIKKDLKKVLRFYEQHPGGKPSDLVKN